MPCLSCCQRCQNFVTVQVWEGVSRAFGLQCERRDGAAGAVRSGEPALLADGQRQALPVRLHQAHPGHAWPRSALLPCPSALAFVAALPLPPLPPWSPPPRAEGGPTSPLCRNSLWGLFSRDCHLDSCVPASTLKQGGCCCEVLWLPSMNGRQQAHAV